MKGFTLTLSILSVCSLESIAQTRLNNLPCVREFQVVHEDTVCRKICILDSIYWIDSNFALPQEYPIKGFISQRSYIVSDNHKYMLDSLIIKNYNEYCLALDMDRAVLVEDEEKSIWY